MGLAIILLLFSLSVALPSGAMVDAGDPGDDTSDDGTETPGDDDLLDDDGAGDEDEDDGDDDDTEGGDTETPPETDDPEDETPGDEDPEDETPGDDDPDEEDPGDDDPDDEDTLTGDRLDPAGYRGRQTGAIFLSGGETLRADDTDDLILAEDYVSPVRLTIDAAGGDDIIDLTGVDDGMNVISGSDVTGGDGDDTIWAGTYDATIRGGAGDDVMFVRGGQSEFLGEDGDDLIQVKPHTTGVGVGSVIDGGAGNDTLDGRLDYRTTLQGGAGDDVLILAAAQDGSQPGFFDGGEGDDTIRIDGSWYIPTGESFITPSGRGGEGADVFEVAVSEGDGDSSSVTDAYFASAAQIVDFTSGEDRLVFDLSTLGESYAAGTLEIEQIDGMTPASTRVSLELIGPEDTRTISITLQGTASLTADDVEILG